jgi:hypothetical protein
VGIQTQVYATSVLTTLRKGLTKLETSGLRRWQHRAALQRQGVGRVRATDSVVVDTDSQGIGLQWSQTSNTDDFAKNLIRARCEGRCPGVGHQRVWGAGHLPYMPNRARRTALTASAGPLTSTRAAR